MNALLGDKRIRLVRGSIPGNVPVDMMPSYVASQLGAAGVLPATIQLAEDKFYAELQTALASNPAPPNGRLEVEARIGRMLDGRFVAGVTASEFRYACVQLSMQPDILSKETVRDFTTYSCEGGVRVRDEVKPNELCRVTISKIPIYNSLCILTLEQVAAMQLQLYFFHEEPLAIRWAASWEVELPRTLGDAKIRETTEIRSVRIMRRRSVVLPNTLTIDCSAVYTGATHYEAQENAKRYAGMTHEPVDGKCVPGANYELEVESNNSTRMPLAETLLTLFFPSSRLVERNTF